jgi:hypothetical protein
MVELIHGLRTRAPIAGVSLVEYVPAADRAGRGAQAVVRLATNAIAAIAGRRAPRAPPVDRAGGGRACDACLSTNPNVQ